MLSTSIKSAEEILSFPPVLIPQKIVLSNYSGVLEALPIGIYFYNSLIVALFTVILNVFISSFTGFALARLRFRGKKALFFLVLLSIILPKEIMIIPVYGMMINAGMADTLSGVIIPFALEGISIFMMRQAFLAIPGEIEEAALMDGAGVFRLWLNVMFPMTLPTVAVVTIFTFIGSWGDFLWPLIILQSKANYTLQVGLQSMLGTFVNNFRFVAAGSMLTVIPVIVVFFLFQKYLIKGIFAGGIK